MIRIERVGKSFDGGRTFVVDDLSLHVREGEIVVLLGESGCGKTTTLKMINRLIPPTSGKIYIDGQDTSQLDDIQLRRNIGYVIQQIGLFPHMTVFENIAIVPRLLNWDEDRIRHRVDDNARLVAQFHPRRRTGGQEEFHVDIAEAHERQHLTAAHVVEAVPDMDVAVADAAMRHLQQHLFAFWLRRRQLDRLQRLAVLDHRHRAHAFPPRVAGRWERGGGIGSSDASCCASVHGMVRAWQTIRSAQRSTTSCMPARIRG